MIMIMTTFRNKLSCLIKEVNPAYVIVLIVAEKKDTNKFIRTIEK